MCLVFLSLPCWQKVEAENQSNTHQKRIFIPSCFEREPRIKRVILKYTSVNSRREQERRYELRHSRLISTGYKIREQRFPSGSKTYFVKDKRQLSKQQIQSLLSKSSESLSKCSFSNGRLTAESAQAFNNNYGYNATDESIGFSRYYLHPSKSYVEEFLRDNPIRSEIFGNVGICLGTIFPPTYSIEIASEESNVKIGCPGDLPCLVQMGSKTWTAYDIETEKTLQDLFSISNMPTWMGSDDEAYWNEHMRKFWNCVLSLRKSGEPSLGLAKQSNPTSPGSPSVHSEYLLKKDEFSKLYGATTY